MQVYQHLKILFFLFLNFEYVKFLKIMVAS